MTSCPLPMTGYKVKALPRCHQSSEKERERERERSNARNGIIMDGQSSKGGWEEIDRERERERENEAIALSY